MRIIDLVRLVTLAAIWGGSFIFMRVLAPVIGPVMTADFRMLIAGVALWTYFKVIGLDLQWRRFWKAYMVVGIANSGVPFLVYAWAALYMPASYLVIVNSTAPLFGGIFSTIWLGERLTTQKLAGILLGAVGVSLVAGVQPPDLNPMFGLALLVSFLSPLCFALSSIYIKKSKASANPAALAGASQLTCGIVMLPLFALGPLTVKVTFTMALNLLGLALLCTALAYLLYFRLIVDVGPTKTLMVSFLIPAFGIVWGIIFLNETVTAAMIIGCGLIVSGTALVLRGPAVACVSRYADSDKA